jgi:very-short-patch-repair endonuclease
MRNPTARARSLRRNQTDAERIFWRHARGRRLHGYKFRRQVWLDRYIADFVCMECNLIVELDGGQHASHEEYDAQRAAHFARLGFTVVRYWNSEVLQNLDGVLSDLCKRLDVERA